MKINGREVKNVKVRLSIYVAFVNGKLKYWRIK